MQLQFRINRGIDKSRNLNSVPMFDGIGKKCLNDEYFDVLRINTLRFDAKNANSDFQFSLPFGPELGLILFFNFPLPGSWRNLSKQSANRIHLYIYVCSIESKIGRKLQTRQYIFWHS